MSAQRAGSARPWRLMVRETDPRSHDAAFCLATFATMQRAQRAKETAGERWPAPKFHVYVEPRS